MNPYDNHVLKIDEQCDLSHVMSVMPAENTCMKMNCVVQEFPNSKFGIRQCLVITVKFGR